MPVPFVSKPPEAVYVFHGPYFSCAYCGDSSDTIDHTVPRHFVAGNAALTARYYFVKVSACRSCNSLAGGKVDATFIDRRRRIAVSLRKRGNKLLQGADWDKDEIAELGRNLRDYIAEAHAGATHLRKRLRMLDNPVPPDGVPNEIFILHVWIAPAEDLDPTTPWERQERGTTSPIVLLVPPP